MKPGEILELGMGQTTKLIGQYASFYKNNGVCHIVCEHDAYYIDAFMKSEEGLINTTIKQMVLGKKEIPKGSNKTTYHYVGFDKKIPEKKFNLIVIDGPYGYNEPYYSRIDVLKIIPHCLSEDFCILLDDYNRIGEKHTAEKIRSVLSNSSIEFYETVRKGETDVLLMVSKSFKYLVYV